MFSFINTDEEKKKQQIEIVLRPEKQQSMAFTHDVQETEKTLFLS